MLPGDRLICTFVEPQTVGLEFKPWLLHVTIVPWFRLGEASDVIALGLERAVYDIVPFDVRTDGEAKLGPRKNRPARLLLPTGQFERIESKARNYLHKKRAFILDETTKKPNSFRPHVTAQGGSMLPNNMKIHVNRLYVVEQKGGCKFIAAETVLPRQAV